MTETKKTKKHRKSIYKVVVAPAGVFDSYAECVGATYEVSVADKELLCTAPPSMCDCKKVGHIIRPGEKILTINVGSDQIGFMCWRSAVVFINRMEMEAFIRRNRIIVELTLELKREYEDLRKERQEFILHAYRNKVYMSDDKKKYINKLNKRLDWFESQEQKLDLSMLE